ncbi:MAG: hypothetical protein LBV19_06065 [Streptococcaceae bacterium]|jgi:hypothetical protein|nr:hypothetical protein [Streptococcaceae bacterium]
MSNNQEEVLHDMIQELTDWLVSDDEIKWLKEAGAVKSFIRPESLAADVTSLTVAPIGPPAQEAMGSNQSLAKKFIYQINVEAAERMTAKKLQRKVEIILLNHGFVQMSDGLDEYFEKTNRYADARRYVGYSPLYENY